MATVGPYVPGQDEYASDNYIPIPGLDPRIAGRQAAEQAWAPANTIYPNPPYDLRTDIAGRTEVSQATRGLQPTPATAAAAGASAAAGTGVDTNLTSAQQQLKAILDGWGLGDLTSWAWDRLTAGASTDEIIYELRQQPTYKNRFAGNTARQAAGLPPMSEADYLSYEQQARQLFQYYGLPRGFYDQPDDFAGMIGKDVSISELNDRVVAARKLVDSESETTKAFARLYGIDSGAATAYFLDESRAVPILQRQVQAANLAGIGARTGFGQIDQMQAEHLAALGITPDQATQGFGQLAGMTQVTGQIVGDLGPGMTQGEQLGAVFDQNAANVEQLSRRQRGRLANFQASSGSFSQTQGV